MKAMGARARWTRAAMVLTSASAMDSVSHRAREVGTIHAIAHDQRIVDGADGRLGERLVVDVLHHPDYVRPGVGVVGESLGHPASHGNESAEVGSLDLTRHHHGAGTRVGIGLGEHPPGLELDAHGLEIPG